MENILEIYEEYLKKQKIIDKEFITLFCKPYLENERLNKIIDKITFNSQSRLVAVYVPIQRYVNINIEKLINEIIKMQNIKQIDKNTIITINNSILATVIHELTHLKQKLMLIEKQEDKRILQILKDSFTIRNLDNKLYKNHHDLFLMEYNANMEAMFKIIEISNKVDYINDSYYVKYLHEQLMLTYVFDELGVMSPLEKFNIINNNYNEIADYSDIDECNKILYGLPIESSTYQKIYDLKKEKRIEPRNYFGGK